MKITIIGSGYVGLVSGICLAKIGHDVICVDNNLNKIEKLNKGEIPIFEPGLKDLLSIVKKENKIKFSNNLVKSIENSKAIFIAVGTPQGEDGSADLSYVMQVVSELARNINDDKLIITKSTVPVGTGAKIRQIFSDINPKNKVRIASNPEFLREGFAIDDFMNPDRIVVGAEDDNSKNILSEIYQYFSLDKMVFSDIVTAELIKYASNSFLATKISFINEMSDLCEVVGGDISKLSYAMGLDSRIGNKFLNPGPGFGGSCFPKDIMAILNIAKNNNIDLSLIESVISSNGARIDKMVKKIEIALGGDVMNKKISLLGLAFKANTDDIRYSPAIAIAKKLAKKGSIILAHDPQAIINAKQELSLFSDIKFCDDIYLTAKNCDALIIATEWDEYKKIDLTKLRKYCSTIIDLRNIYNKHDAIKAGFKYTAIGYK